ncbi:hypothetical protein M8J77_016827 [Diaphorina citri]|nr:hypothetical protein M8J77_016827 [Diaphorina citri]
MIRSTVQTVNQKYHQVKSGNIFVNLVLSTIELCVYLCVKLVGQIQTYDYRKYLTQMNHYVYVGVCQYATPVLWCQLRDAFQRVKDFTLDVSYGIAKYLDNLLCSGMGGFDSPHAQVNFDSPNMNTLIDLLTRSLAELKIKENNSLLELSGYHQEFQHSGVIVEHSSTSCDCEKHHDDHVYTNNNNNVDTLTAIEYHSESAKHSMSHKPSEEPTSESSIAHENIMADMEDQTSQTEDIPTNPQTEDQDTPGKTTSQEWHKLYPSSQPMIPMMTEGKAFELAEALKEKRQDKTGRDAYEVDTVLVLLSQWNVIDEKSKHYAIDRANLLYLAICYGWSYALQKVSPSTTAPIVTPPVTIPSPGEHSPLHRQHSNDSNTAPAAAAQAKNLRKNVISRSHSSVYSNDSGKHHYNGYNGYFHRPNNGYYRRSFPPNMYQQSHYDSSHFYGK